ncbi:MAG: hypothetical protein HQM16_14495 [Deltaproteobacteria bacterium]|nr:hypothetical protein [Deltaproteobacteria bacterium]
MNKFMQHTTVFFVLILVCLLNIHCGDACGVTETCNPDNTTGYGDTQTSGGDNNTGDGTGIFDGNPADASVFYDPDEESAPMIAETASTTDILQSICEVLSNCYNLTDTNACVTSLETDQGLLTEFGVDTDTYSSFDDVQDAIDASGIETSGAEISYCTQAISEVSCDTIEAGDAYSTETPTDFSDVFMMMPDEC